MLLGLHLQKQHSLLKGGGPSDVYFSTVLYSSSLELKNVVWRATKDIYLHIIVF